MQSFPMTDRPVRQPPARRPVRPPPALARRHPGRPAGLRKLKRMGEVTGKNERTKEQKERETKEREQASNGPDREKKTVASDQKIPTNERDHICQDSLARREFR